jgi:hypothetical protein
MMVLPMGWASRSYAPAQPVRRSLERARPVRARRPKPSRRSLRPAMELPLGWSRTAYGVGKPEVR